MTRRPRHNIRGERMKNLLAEALSETGSIPASARQLGISYDYAKVLFQRVCAELGREQCR